MTIGLVEGTPELTLSSNAPIRVLPHGEQGAEVLGGRRWRVRLLEGRAAQLSWFVVLARQASGGFAKLSSEKARWASRGARTSIVEVGAIFGMQGQVFDSRALLLCDGPYRSAAQARARGEQYLARGWITRLKVLPQLERLPSGTIEATDVERGVVVRAHDLLWLAPQTGGLLSLQSARNESGAYRGHLGGRYRGQLYVTIDRRGQLAAANRLPADQLLAGLVAAEIFPQAPAAALEAQAIAARGNLLAQIGVRNRADPYLTCAWQRCQVYRGVEFEHRRTSRAIRSTRGMVLTHRKAGGLVDAVYHAHSGGYTEDNENVWPGQPNAALRGKLDAPGGVKLGAFRRGIDESNIRRWLALRPATWGQASGFNRDKLRWQSRQTVQSLSLRHKDRRIGRIAAIRVLQRGRSGRATLVELKGSSGQVQIRGELAIRRALGNLHSSMFVVDPQRDSTGKLTAFVFRGGGWGHGVGMSQTGAIGMARDGKDYRTILAHYYAATRVMRIY